MTLFASTPASSANEPRFPTPRSLVSPRPADPPFSSFFFIPLHPSTFHRMFINSLKPFKAFANKYQEEDEDLFRTHVRRYVAALRPDTGVAFHETDRYVARLSAVISRMDLPLD